MCLAGVIAASHPAPGVSAAVHVRPVSTVLCPTLIAPGGGPGVPDIDVPAGADLAEARRSLAEQGLPAEVIPPSWPGDAGTVVLAFGYLPQRDAIEQATAYRATICVGLIVPSLSGLSADQAEGTLTRAGLLAAADPDSATQPDAQVDRQSPAAGTAVPPGSTVTIHLAAVSPTSPPSPSERPSTPVPDRGAASTPATPDARPSTSDNAIAPGRDAEPLRDVIWVVLGAVLIGAIGGGVGIARARRRRPTPQAHSPASQPPPHLTLRVHEPPPDPSAAATVSGMPRAPTDRDPTGHALRLVAHPDAVDPTLRETPGDPATRGPADEQPSPRPDPGTRPPGRPPRGPPHRDGPPHLPESEDRP